MKFKLLQEDKRQPPGLYINLDAVAYVRGDTSNSSIVHFIDGYKLIVNIPFMALAKQLEIV